MNFIDTCAFIGRTPHRQYPITTAEEMVDTLRRYGIARAVVFHRYAEDFDTSVGNARLLDEISGHSELIPQFVVNLPAEKVSADTFLDRMLAQGVRCVRLSPTTQNYRIRPWTASPWLDAFQARRVPVWLDFSGTNWEDLEYLAGDFPQLRLVLAGVHYNEHQMIRPFLRRYPQVHMGLHKYDVFDGLKKLCGEFGTDRFLYGAGLPEFDPGAWKYYLEHSGLSEEEAKKIAGGNCERLLTEAGG